MTSSLAESEKTISHQRHCQLREMAMATDQGKGRRHGRRLLTQGLFTAGVVLLVVCVLGVLFNVWFMNKLDSGELEADLNSISWRFVLSAVYGLAGISLVLFDRLSRKRTEKRP